MSAPPDPEAATLWRSRFADLEPLGWRLRAALPERWLRVHALPGSKRYADTEAERQEIRTRARALASVVLGEGPVWLLVLEERGVPELPALGLAPALRFEADAPADAPRIYLAAKAPWRGPAFEALVEAIADDRCRALWLEPATGELLAPYDGGFDLILADGRRRDALAARWAGWLSSRPDGL